jgi:hypothetical protein
MINKIKLFLFTALMLGVLIGGDDSRLGTTAGTQVNIPVGARNLAMAGADLVFTSGVDAIYWNPASIATIPGATAVFSNMSYIADINVFHLAVGMPMGKAGNIGLYVKSLGFGDIPITTYESIDGTGATYSPTVMTAGLTYGKQFTDRIMFGITSKIVYESIPRASASAFAFDVGVVYVNFAGIDGLGLALVLKNIGSDMHYTGSGLKTEATESNFTEFFDRESSYDQLPSSYTMASSYKIGESILLGAAFVSNNTSFDEFNFGGEFDFNDMLFVRGGLTTGLVDEVDKDNVLYGLHFGVGLKYNLRGVGLQLDYAYRSVEYFDANHLITVGFTL